ncbi:MAG: rRNA (uracil1498-N3)-methyltransferase [Bryobacterales bacterium]|jgi:16S rRNA (uracil1498-N3)-methyltransferase|nr:rRNA (uracil1498-N3)-methyltransferase [Bryobacterales bacterium]
MARRRFFVDRVEDGRAEISGDDAHHLTRVLRVEVGQQYEITDTHRVWLATIDAARKNLVQFSVVEELEAAASLPQVTLYLALIKFDRFEWAVEKATELGVTGIVPVSAARSDPGLSQGAKKRAERWRRIAKEASEQSRRARAPEIADPLPFAQAIRQPSTHRIWLDENDRTKPLMQAFTLTPGDSSALMVGPEGGWSDSERVAFAQAGWIGASLGPCVLRAETAVCAVLAIFAQLAMASATGEPDSKAPGPFTIEAADAV